MLSEYIYRRALKTYGAEAQTRMVFEEMAELQKELCKNARGADNVDAIAEEIADVQIMLEQMIVLHDCREEVEDHWMEKMIRLMDRLEEKEKMIRLLDRLEEKRKEDGNE